MTALPMITVSMVSDSRPGTGTRIPTVVFTVPRIGMAPGGIGAVPTVASMADTYQEDRRPSGVSTGTSGKTLTIPSNAQR